MPCKQRSVGITIADYNRDDWLDIAVVCALTHRARISWGSEDGFDAQRVKILNVPSAIDTETADLNADGHLDLIVASYEDPLTGRRDTGSLIHWGSDKGYQHWNAQ